MILSLKSKFSRLISRGFFISSSKLAVYHWYKHGHKQGIAESYLFDANADGFGFFQHYLNDNVTVSAYILLDIVSEEHHIDTIPHVFGANRKAVIERKKARIFKDAPYFYAQIQGREDSGRRDDKIMLSALTSHQDIQPWLQILEDNKVPIVGMGSLPLLVQDKTIIIPDMEDNALVFSLQSISGLRQSFFLEGALKFSRLVTMPRYGRESYIPIIDDELVKMRRYIENASLIDGAKPLDFYLIGDHQLLQKLREQHPDSSALHYHLLDITMLGKACGMDEQFLTPFSDKYFIHQLLKYRRKNYYANWRETRYFHMQRMNELLRTASYLLILLGVIWTGINILQGVDYRQQHRLEAQRVKFYSDSYVAERERMPQLPINPSDLKVAVDINNTLQMYKADPVAMFKLISGVLEKFPTINISQLKWITTIDPHQQLLSVKQVNAASNQDRPSADNTADYLYYQIAVFDGYFKDFDGDHRQVLATIEQFVSELKQQVYDASIFNPPLDTDSNAKLEGSTNKNVARSNFSIRVVLGVKHEA